jgi:hypothetical protein
MFYERRYGINRRRMQVPVEEERRSEADRRSVEDRRKGTDRRTDSRADNSHDRRTTSGVIELTD